MSLQVRNTLFVAIASALTMSLMGNVHASELKDVDQSGQESDQVKQLDAVTVTASKREQSIQEVPNAVSVVTSTELRDQNLVELRDYYSRIPGLSFSSGSSGQAQVSIRGMTVGTSGGPTTAVVIDDIPFGSSTGYGYGSRLVPDLDPSQIARIEVLRGPQGTLYGASSLGGMIKYVTKTPSLDEFSARVEAGINTVDGGSNGWSTRVAADMPLSKGVAGLSVSGFYREDAGYIDFASLSTGRLDDANSSRSDGGRVALRLQPSEKVTIDLQALKQNLNGFGANSVLADANFNLVGDDLVNTITANLAKYSTGKNLYSGKVEVDLGFAGFTSLTAYNESRYAQLSDTTAQFAPVMASLGLPGRTSILSNIINTDKFNQEFRLTSQTEGAFDWMVGLFHTQEESNILQILDAMSPAGALERNLLDAAVTTDFKETALFTDFNWRLSDKFNLQFGARYSKIDQKYLGLTTGPLAGGSSRADEGSSENSFTWMIAPQYALTDKTMLYFRAASGYRAGGPNTPVPGTPTMYDSDSVVNYELGIKGASADHTFNWAAALYRIDWEDIHVTLRNAQQLGYNGNGGGARSEGLELEFSWRPWMGMTLAGNTSYNSPKLTDNILGSAVGGAMVGLPGDRLPFSAKWSGHLSADQTFDIANDWWGSVGLSATYAGDRLGEFPTVVNVPRAMSPAYTSFDFRGQLTNDVVRIGFYIRNLTDKRAAVTTAIRTATNVANGYSVSLLNPRTYGLTVSYDF